MFCREFQRYQELHALLDQKGPPTFFWTVSSADTYWPELHKLMIQPNPAPATHSMRIQAVINNPHITDWYFTTQLSDWVEHWLYKTLDAGIGMNTRLEAAHMHMAVQS